MSVETESEKVYWSCDHSLFWTHAFGNALYHDAQDQRNSGFVYAGFAHGLLKVGMTSKQCPFCRMDQQRLEYKAIAFSNVVFEHEQLVIRVLGDPVKGREWFNEPEPRLKFLIEEGLLNCLLDTERKLCQMYEDMVDARKHRA